jgi:hypothetical protein
MATKAFWSNGQEVTRESVPCPTARCKGTAHPKEVRYQHGTSRPAVIWVGGCGHKYFSCSVQDWYPTTQMRMGR